MFRNLGTALVLARTLRAKAQAQVARDAGIGKSQLSKYENGKELPKLDSLEKVLSSLGIGYLEFFYIMSLIDERSEHLGKKPQHPFSIAAGRSFLDERMQTGFRRLLDGFFELYGFVIRSLFTTPPPTPWSPPGDLDESASRSDSTED